jgi:hypothetical protein
MMALTELQRAILALLAANRSQSSYVAGGLVLNRDWPRTSDDIDVFHDTDEEIVEAARRDIEALRQAGFAARVDVETYGMVEATIGREGSETIIQWMSESRRRFLPLVNDQPYGFRLSQADLAVNKVLAAGARRKARDYVDLVSIARSWCPLGPLVLAASGKPPFYSPSRIIEEIRRRGLGVWDDEYRSVKGLPEDWSPAFVREALSEALDKAQAYVERAPLEALGRLVSDKATMTPAEIMPDNAARLEFRRATDEQIPVPEFKDALPAWRS